MKIKCPVCKEIRDFKQVHISCTREYCYLEGDYLWIYRCEKCHIIIAKEEELK